MRQVAFVLATILSTLAMASGGPRVQLAQYPYYHEPGLAWRVTIASDGTVRREESAAPVKTAVVSELKGIKWVSVSQHSKSRISDKKLRVLLNRLRDLDLATLGADYSAQYSFLVPGQETVVITESGDSYTIPAEATRMVTHGATYQLRVDSTELTVDSSVYAPLSALEWENPRHPDRSQIAKIVAAWYYVLRAIGPVGGCKAKTYRPYLK